MPGQCGGIDDAVCRVSVKGAKGVSPHSDFPVHRNLDQPFV